MLLSLLMQATNMLRKRGNVSFYIPIEVLFFHPILSFGHFFDDAANVPHRLAL